MKTLSWSLAVVWIFSGKAVWPAERAPALFDASHGERGWQEDHAAGFAQPVCGVVYRLKDSVGGQGLRRQLTGYAVRKTEQLSAPAR